MGKKLSLIALILLVIGGIGSAVTYGSMHEKVIMNEKVKITNENITSIQVDVDGEDVELIPVSDMTEARVELVGKDVKSTMNDFSLKEDGTTLSITMLHENKKWFNFTLYQTSLKLKIFVPEKIFSKIHINGFSSDIHVQNISAKNIEIVTDSGDIKAKKIKPEQMNAKTFSGDIHLDHVQGEVFMGTDSGDINVVNGPAKSIKANTFSGDIALKNVEGSLSTQTDSGDVFLSTREITHPIQGKTFSGDIKIATDQKPANIQFDVGTLSGDVNLFNKYSNHASTGNGNILIQLETDSGDITATHQ